jgi:organic hydroperoxide reductase OsmC/OhrA
MSQTHNYASHLIWEGNRGDGTATYSGYGREFRIAIPGKPELRGSADPAFRGSPELLNPEDLFLAAVSSCHMLSYLALCAREHIRVLAYDDRPTAELQLERGGGGRFTTVVLHPEVVIAAGDDAERALALHERAHELCFVAGSCSVPIRHDAAVRTLAEVVP